MQGGSWLSQTCIVSFIIQYLCQGLIYDHFLFIDNIFALFCYTIYAKKMDVNFITDYAKLTQSLPLLLTYIKMDCLALPLTYIKMECLLFPVTYIKMDCLSPVLTFIKMGCLSLLPLTYIKMDCLPLPLDNIKLDCLPLALTYINMGCYISITTNLY